MRESALNLGLHESKAYVLPLKIKLIKSEFICCLYQRVPLRQGTHSIFFSSRPSSPCLRPLESNRLRQNEERAQGKVSVEESSAVGKNFREEKRKVSGGL